MQRIPPHERYSHNAASADIPKDLLEKAIQRHSSALAGSAVRRLEGGFQNANFLVEQRGERFVFRFYAAGKEAAAREVGLLRLLEHRDVKAPRLLNVLEVEAQSVVVLEFLSGEMLQSRLERTVPISLFRQVGEELGRVHGIEFERAGFIGENARVGNQYETFSPFLKGFIVKTLMGVHEDRLSANARDRALKLVEDRWSVVDSVEPLRQLVHCDFNPKNLLVAEDGAVTGLLDWEFCISGNGYIDLGNFFRFAQDYPEGAMDEFVAGYESVRGKLAREWREISLLMDLGNMCSFLERREDYQKSFRTARLVIDATLAHFGY